MCKDFKGNFPLKFIYNLLKEKPRPKKRKMSYKNYGDFGRKSEPIQGNVTEIQSEEHKQQLIEQARQTGSLLCVDIWGSFCGPCKQARPAYEALSLKYPSVLFCAEDVRLEITPEATVVPWFQFYGQGQLLEDKKGADMENIERIVLKYLQNPPQQGRTPQPPQGQMHPKGQMPQMPQMQGRIPQPPQGQMPPQRQMQGQMPGGYQPGGNQTGGQYARGPSLNEGYQDGPSMGSYPITQRPGGNPNLNHNRPPPISYDMQRPDPNRIPHGVRPTSHRNIR